MEKLTFCFCRRGDNLAHKERREQPTVWPHKIRH